MSGLFAIATLHKKIAPLPSLFCSNKIMAQIGGEKGGQGKTHSGAVRNAKR